MTELARKIAQEIKPLLEQDGIELVYVEYIQQRRQPTLRVFIDKEGGVTVNDCQRISEIVSPVLDATSLFTSRYLLEVSSPGFDRPLTKEKDFVRFAGQPVRVKTHAPVGGQKVVSGTLRGLRGAAIVVEVDGSEVEIPVADVAVARLDL